MLDATSCKPSHQRTEFVAYYRVSTEKQGRSGLGLEAQQRIVRAFVDGSHAKLLQEVVEVESGRVADRPRLTEALRLCRIHSATLIIAKLDRLARNVAFVSSLMDSRLDFVAADFPAANRLTIHILAAVAEHEATLIRDRTRAALAAARVRGRRLGGDRGNLRSVSHLGTLASIEARRAKAQQRANDLAPLLVEMRNRGLSIRSIAHELDLRNVQTSRGGRWSASQVHRLLRTLSC